MWKPIDTAPERTVVMTKIDDDKGSRNEQALRLLGRMWHYPDESMYVYYRPTHWRPLTDAEREKERARMQLALDDMLRVASQI